MKISKRRSQMTMTTAEIADVYTNWPARVAANSMAIASRIEFVKDGETVTRVRSVERECVVISIALGMAKIEWCDNGQRTAKPVSQLRPE